MVILPGNRAGSAWTPAALEEGTGLKPQLWGEVGGSCWPSATAPASDSTWRWRSHCPLPSHRFVFYLSDTYEHKQYAAGSMQAAGTQRLPQECTTVASRAWRPHSG